MAQFNAAQMRRTTKMSGRVQNAYKEFTGQVVEAADAGFYKVAIPVASDIAEAIARRFKKDGFDAYVRSDNKVHVSWEEKEASNTSIAIQKDLEKAEQYYAEKPSETQKCNECCVSVNGKLVDDPKPTQRKKPLPTPPSSTAPATNQTGVTVFKNGKPVTTQQQTKQANNQSQKKRGKKRHYNNNRGNNMFNRCVVIERCTFNVTVTVDDINVSK